MKTSERKCPHCNGDLSKYEDPLAIKMLADAEAKTHPNPQMLKALQMAYQKHHIGLVEIGWDQLSDTLHDALCEAMGDAGYQEWIRSMRGSEREVLF